MSALGATTKLLVLIGRFWLFRTEVTKESKTTNAHPIFQLTCDSVKEKEEEQGKEKERKGKKRKEKEVKKRKRK
jgi:hypothetical protein